MSAHEFRDLRFDFLLHARCERLPIEHTCRHTSTVSRTIRKGSRCALPGGAEEQTDDEHHSTDAEHLESEGVRVLWRDTDLVPFRGDLTRHAELGQYAISVMKNPLNSVSAPATTTKFPIDSTSERLLRSAASARGLWTRP